MGIRKSLSQKMYWHTVWHYGEWSNLDSGCPTLIRLLLLIRSRKDTVFWPLIVLLSFVNNKIGKRRYTLWSSSQSPHLPMEMLLKKLYYFSIHLKKYLVTLVIHRSLRVFGIRFNLSFKKFRYLFF